MKDTKYFFNGILCLILFIIKNIIFHFYFINSFHILIISEIKREILSEIKYSYIKGN